MKNFKELRVWQKSHQLALDTYSLTKQFPKEEIYGLTSQIRRSAISIPSNIAEGCGRNSDAELNRFLVIAMGSASELEYQLMLSKDLEFIQLSDYETLNESLVEIKKMLNMFIQKLK
jgi:four helix bundle protein